MLRRTLAVAVLVGFASLMWPAWHHVAFAEEPDIKPKELRTDMGRKLAGDLMCQCGCGLTVAACRDSMTCTMASGLVEQIERQVGAGKTESEIKDYFVSVYGEQILALPTKSGFNLTAWTMPFIVVIAGAMAVTLSAWLWVRRRAAAGGTAEPAAEAPTLSSYEERVDRDMLLME